MTLSLDTGTFLAAQGRSRSAGRRLLVAIILVAIVIAGAQPFLVDAFGRRFLGIEVTIAALVSAGFQVRAALGFRRGEYLWRAYSLQAATYLVAAVLVLLPGASSLPGQIVSNVGTLVANSLFVAATFMFSRAFASAGLELPGHRWHKVGIMVVLGIGAIALGGQAMWRCAQAALGGDLGQLHQLQSFVGDFAILLLLGPLVATSVALRGGLLVWPSALFALASASWIVTDSQQLITTLVGSSAGTAHAWMNLWPVYACLFAAAAAHAQRAVINSSPQ